jgi:hypothetical protein
MNQKAALFGAICLALGGFFTFTLAEMGKSEDGSKAPSVAAEKPHRFKFAAYTGDPKNPRTMDFQINTLDPKLQSNFLKLGDIIPGTHLRLQKFDGNAVRDGTASGDFSQLTLIETETGKTFVLVLGRVFSRP